MVKIHVSIRKIIVVIPTIIISVICSSCWLRKMTCQESIDDYSNLEFEIIVDEVKWNGNDLRLYGRSSKFSNKDSDVHLYCEWNYNIGDKFYKGDTLIKKKGEPIIRAYRKGERWSFSYNCENEIVSYKNVRF
jgi:hypothetical protein